jgi:hypothetical protein
VNDEDHVQLERLVTEVAFRIDHGRAETVHELFLEDGTLDLGDRVLRGKDSIQAWGREIVEQKTYPGIRHVCTNMRFVADGENAAEGIVINTVYMDPAEDPGTTVPFVVGEDYDRFIRTDRGWRFESRRWKALFVRKESGQPISGRER